MPGPHNGEADVHFAADTDPWSRAVDEDPVPHPMPSSTANFAKPGMLSTLNGGQSRLSFRSSGYDLFPAPPGIDEPYGSEDTDVPRPSFFSISSLQNREHAEGRWPDDILESPPETEKLDTACTSEAIQPKENTESKPNPGAKEENEWSHGVWDLQPSVQEPSPLELAVTGPDLSKFVDEAAGEQTQVSRHTASEEEVAIERSAHPSPCASDRSEMYHRSSRSSYVVTARLCLHLLSIPESYTRKVARCPACCVCLGFLIVLTAIGVGMVLHPPEPDTNFDSFMKTDVNSSVMRDGFEVALESVRKSDSRRLQGIPIYQSKPLELAYVLREGSNIKNILDFAAMLKIAQFEQEILALPEWQAACAKVAAWSTLQCQRGISLVNYMLPTTTTSGTSFVPSKLTFDGRSSNELPFEVAYRFIQQHGVSEIIMPRDFDPEKLESVTTFRSVFVAKVLTTSTADSKSVQTSKREKVKAELEHLMEEVLLPFLDKQAEKSLDEFPLHVYFRGDGLTETETMRALMKDSLWAIGSLVLVLSYLVFHTRSFFLAIFGLLIIVLSVPFSYVVYALISGSEKVSIASFLSLFLIVGLGSDVIFVYTDFWRDSEERLDDTIDRLIWTYRNAGKASFATTFTTALSFFANLASVLRPLREFGTFMGMCVVFVWMLASLIYLPLCVADESYCSCCRLRFARRSAKNGLMGRLQLARIIQSWRWTLLLISVLLAIAAAIMVPVELETDMTVPNIFPEDHNQNRGKKLFDDFAPLQDVMPFAFQDPLESEEVCGSSALANVDLMDGCKMYWCEADEAIAQSSAEQCSCFRKQVRTDSCYPPKVRQRLVGLSSLSSESLLALKIHTADALNLTVSDLLTVQKYVDMPPAVLQEWEQGSTTVQMVVQHNMALPDRLSDTTCGWDELCFCNAPVCRPASSSWSSALPLRLQSNRALAVASDDAVDNLDVASLRPPFRLLSTAGTLQVPTNLRGSVEIVLGIHIKPGSPLIGERAPEDTWSYLESFEANNPWAQRDMYSLCKTAEDSDLRVVEQLCWVEDFRNFLLAQDKRFPVFPASSFKLEFDNFKRGGYVGADKGAGKFVWEDSNSVKACYIAFSVDVSTKASEEYILEYQKKWNNFVSGWNAQASPFARGAWHTSKLWVEAQARRELKSSTITTLLIVMLLAFLGMLAFTTDIALAIYVVLATLWVVIGLSFFIVVLMKWPIGPIEVIALIAFIGYAVTYSLHVAHKYGDDHAVDSLTAEEEKSLIKSKPGEIRQLRLAFSLRSIGTAALGSAATTMGSAFFLLFTVLTIFGKLGAVVLAVTVLSIIGALVPLPALLLIAGPLKPGLKNCRIFKAAKTKLRATTSELECGSQSACSSAHGPEVLRESSHEASDIHDSGVGRQGVTNRAAKEAFLESREETLISTRSPPDDEVIDDCGSLAPSSLFATPEKRPITDDRANYQVAQIGLPPLPRPVGECPIAKSSPAETLRAWSPGPVRLAMNWYARGVIVRCPVVCSSIVLALAGTIAVVGLSQMKFEIDLDHKSLLKVAVDASNTHDAFEAAVESREGGEGLDTSHRVFHLAILYNLLESARNPSGIFDFGAVSSAANFEQRLRASSAWKKMCGLVSVDFQKLCNPGVSLVNYMLPTQISPTGDVVPTSLNTDGLGKDKMYTSVAVQMLKQHNASASILPLTHDDAAPETTTTFRSVFVFRIPTNGSGEQLEKEWKSFLSQEALPIIEDPLGEQADSFPYRLTVTGSFVDEEIWVRELTKDAGLLAGCLALAVLYMMFHTRSIFLGLIALFITALSVALALVVWGFVAQSAKFNVVSLLVPILVADLTSGVACLYSDSWRSSKGFESDTELRLSWMYYQAGRVSVTSLISVPVPFTVAAMLSNTSSLRELGFLLGFSLVFAWVLLSLAFGPLCAVNEACEVRYRARKAKRRRWRCCRIKAPRCSLGCCEVEDILRYLYRWRCPCLTLLFLFGVLICCIVLRFDILVMGGGELFGEAYSQNHTRWMLDKFAPLDGILRNPGGFNVPPSTEDVCRYSAGGDCSLFWCEVSMRVEEIGDDYEAVFEYPARPNASQCQCFEDADCTFGATTVRHRFVGLEAATPGLEQQVLERIGRAKNGLNASISSSRRLPPLLLQQWESGIVDLQPVVEVQSEVDFGYQRTPCGWKEICFCGTPVCKLTKANQVADLDLINSTGISSIGTPQIAAAGRYGENFVDVVFGIGAYGAMPLFGKQDSSETWSFLDEFSVFHPQTQRDILAVCRDVSTNLRVTHTLCWMQHFKDWLISRGDRWPVRKAEDFNELLLEFAASGNVDGTSPKSYFWFQNGVMRACYVKFYVGYQEEGGLEGLKKLQESWDGYLKRWNSEASPFAQGAWHTSALWVQLETEDGLVSSLGQCWAVFLLMAFLGVLVSTLDLALALATLATLMWSLFLFLFFLLVISRWDFGPIQVTLVFPFVAFAATFSSYFVQKYCELHFSRELADDAILRIVPGCVECSSGKAARMRYERTSYALCSIAKAMLGCIIQSLGGSVLLLFSSLSLFRNAGVAMISSVVVSAASAFFLLPMIVSTMGPRNPGQLANTREHMDSLRKLFTDPTARQECYSSVAKSARAAPASLLSLMSEPFVSRQRPPTPSPLVAIDTPNEALDDVESGSTPAELWIDGANLSKTLPPLATLKESEDLEEAPSPTSSSEVRSYESSVVGEGEDFNTRGVCRLGPYKLRI